MLAACSNKLVVAQFKKTVLGIYPYFILINRQGVINRITFKWQYMHPFALRCFIKDSISKHRIQFTVPLNHTPARGIFQTRHHHYFFPARVFKLVHAAGCERPYLFLFCFKKIKYIQIGIAVAYGVRYKPVVFK